MCFLDAMNQNDRRNSEKSSSSAIHLHRDIVSIPNKRYFRQFQPSFNILKQAAPRLGKWRSYIEATTSVPSRRSRKVNAIRKQRMKTVSSLAVLHKPCKVIANRNESRVQFHSRSIAPRALFSLWVRQTRVELSSHKWRWWVLSVIPAVDFSFHIANSCWRPCLNDEIRQPTGKPHASW